MKAPRTLPIEFLPTLVPSVPATSRKDLAKPRAFILGDDRKTRVIHSGVSRVPFPFAADWLASCSRNLSFSFFMRNDRW